MLSPPSESSRHAHRPLPLGSTHSASSQRPHIRTPSPGLSTYHTMPASTPSIPFLQTLQRLPRAVHRGLAIALLLLSALFLLNVSRGGIEEGMWDASSYSDRRGLSHHSNNGGLAAVKKRIDQWSNPDQQPITTSLPFALPRPNLARLNLTAHKPIHPGFSRLAVPGAPDKYTTHPLPTFDEAFERLNKRLREVKAKFGNIPAEHQLWNPIFNPSLTDDFKIRYHHLRMDWDEEREEWVEANKRWLFVCVCRQVAGEFYA
jgi:alpha-1,3-mannosyltransferase